MPGTPTSPLTSPLDLVRLRPLMALGEGRPAIRIGLVDGPVATAHPDLTAARIEPLAPGGIAGSAPPGEACEHATFVAGVLVARRGSVAPAICPGCTLLVRPIFADTPATGGAPAASTIEVAQAIVECVDAGAQIVNLSVATGAPTARDEESLRDALDYGGRRGVLIVAAAGNQGAIGSSAITRHQAVTPVVGYDLRGRPLAASNFAGSTARRGLGAPGEDVVSLAATGTSATKAGTSLAVAFVSGTLALLWSLFPSAEAGELRRALLDGPRRATVIPPLMNAERAHGNLAAARP